MAREHDLGTSDNIIPHLPRFLVILACIIFPILFICALVSLFCPNCTELQHDVRRVDHQTPIEPPSIAPLESIWVNSLDPPPPYSQVGLSDPIPNVFHSLVSNVLK